MRSHFSLLKPKAIELRKSGKTYGEIRRVIGEPIPKSTLSLWFKNIVLSDVQKEKIKKLVGESNIMARDAALKANKIKRENYLNSIEHRVNHLGGFLKNKDIAKIALAMLYLGGGAKRSRSHGSLMIGNSDPKIIELFLRLLRYCYNIDENKFRCTLQCRADQNIKVLEEFWFGVTKIPRNQFYKAQIDPRTIGKPSKKIDYKGVCRIDYFSREIFLELMKIAEVVYKNGLVA